MSLKTATNGDDDDNDDKKSLIDKVIIKHDQRRTVCRNWLKQNMEYCFGFYIPLKVVYDEYIKENPNHYLHTCMVSNVSYIYIFIYIYT